MRVENNLQIPVRTQNMDLFFRAIAIAGECVLLIFLIASNFASEGVRTDGPETFQLSYILLLIVLDLCMLFC